MCGRREASRVADKNNAGKGNPAERGEWEEAAIGEAIAVQTLKELK